MPFVEDAELATRFEGCEEPAEDAFYGDGAVVVVGEAEGGVDFPEILEPDDLFALTSRHESSGEVRIAEKGSKIASGLGQLEQQP